MSRISFTRAQMRFYLRANLQVMQPCYQKLTDSQWEIIEKIIESKRKRWHSLGRICNVMLWMVYTGSQWRNLESKL